MANPVVFLTVMAVICIGGKASSLPAEPDSNFSVTFVSSQELNKLLQKNPNLVELQRTFNNFTNVYALGERTRCDRVVVHDAQKHSFWQQTIVEHSLSYPLQGYGDFVTYVKINVRQSTDKGRALVTKGGLGYRYITVVVEALDTYYYESNATIYAQRQNIC